MPASDTKAPPPCRAGCRELPELSLRISCLRQHLNHRVLCKLVLDGVVISRPYLADGVDERSVLVRADVYTPCCSKHMGQLEVQLDLLRGMGGVRARATAAVRYAGREVRSAHASEATHYTATLGIPA